MPSFRTSAMQGQDRKDQPRVAITAKLVANLIANAGRTGDYYGLTRSQVQGFFDIPVDHLYCSQVFMESFKKNENSGTLPSLLPMWAE